jgi:hypothetical protein
LNVCPYRATAILHRRPQVLGSIEATSIVTRGATSFSLQIQMLTPATSTLWGLSKCHSG